MPVFVGALLSTTLVVGVVEMRLKWRGFQPTIPDTESLWIEHRHRASKLGERALILVGGSRIQLATDLDMLRRHTGLEPVQLAIDGSSFVPVLDGLARDPTIRGTVLVDFYDEALLQTSGNDTAARWQAAFERSRDGLGIPTFADVEGRLTRAWRGRLRSYADGAQPLTSIQRRLLQPSHRRQYLVMRADRSRLANYRNVPDLYHLRVLHNLGDPSGRFDPAEIQRRIGAVPPRLDLRDAYAAAARRVNAMSQAIERRGGRVHFLVLPRSGLIRELEERRYPQEVFWDRFLATANSRGIHYTDVPAWRDLWCPDGSHLDASQRAPFTDALIDVLGIRRPER